MANKEVKSKMNIGSSSLILIFIVLCLATFGLLSLSSAKSDWNLAQKNAAAVKGYYDADSKGEEFYSMASDTLQKILLENSGESTMELMKKEFGEYYREDTGYFTVEIPMDYDQALHIELALSEDDTPHMDKKTWKVINTVDYEIDDSMPVWSGQ